MTAQLHDIATLAGHRDRITSLAFAPGRHDVVLSAGRDGAVAVWTIVGEESAEAELIRHEAPVRFADFWPDARGIIMASDDGATRLVDLDSGEEAGRYTLVDELRPGANRPTGIVKTVNDTAKMAGTIVSAVVPLGGLITAAANQGGTKSAVQHAVADAPLGRLAALTADHTVALYDLVSMDLIRKWSVPADDHSRLAFVGGQLVVAGSSRLLVLKESSDKPEASVRPTRSAIRGLVVLDDTRLATLDASKTFTIWDAHRRTAEGGFRAPVQPVHARLCGKDRVLIADAGGRVAVLPIASRIEPVLHQLDAGKVRAIAASDDGTRFAVAGDDLKVMVFETPG